MKSIDKLSQVDDKLLDPTQLSFRLKGSIRKRIKSLLESDQGDEETKQELAQLVDDEDDNKQTLSYESLSEIHKRIQRLDPTYNMYFFELLDECRAMVPNSRENKELDSRLKRLQFEASGKSYNKMASLPNSKPGVAMNISSEVRELRPIMITLINSILVVAGSFFFVFKAVEYSMNEPDIVVQVLASLVVASIVAIAELYFLIKII